MNGRLIRALLLASLVLAAGCKGDEPEEEQGSAGFVLPGEEPYVSPEDSAKAEEDDRARAEALRDSLRRAAGDRRGEEDARPAAATGESTEARYAACMAQASQADAEMRGRLQSACENIRAQPSPDAPAP